MRNLELSKKRLKKTVVLALTVSMTIGAVPIDVYAEEPAEKGKIIIETDSKPEQEITEDSDSAMIQIDEIQIDEIQEDEIQVDEIQVDGIQDKLQTIEVNEPGKEVDSVNDGTSSDGDEDAEEPAEPEEIIIEIYSEPKQEITEDSESVVIQVDDIQVDAVQDELQTIEVNEPVKKVEGSNGETGSDSGNRSDGGEDGLSTPKYKEGSIVIKSSPSNPSDGAQT